jgi:hypothetical protein
MNKIPTAEEYFEENLSGEPLTQESVIEGLIEFTKLHVKAALENAYDCHTFKGWTNSDDENVHKELFVKNIMSRKTII